MDDGGSPTTGMKKLSNRLMKLFGVDTDDVTEEEIISMVNEGHEQGVLQANEAEMIHNIFEFGDKDSLRKFVGKEFRTSIAILDEGFAKQIIKYMSLSENMEV